MNFLYCGNKKVLRGINLGILSILESNPGPHHFYIFTMDVPFLKEKGIGIHEDDVKKTRELVAKYHKDNKLILMDVYGCYEERILNTKYKDSPYTPYTYLRLFADKYINEDKILYLDADTMCYKGITRFDDYDISNVEAAVVKDTLGRFWIRPNYFNAGVIYFNMKLCRERQTVSRALDYLLCHKLYFFDQSALNEVIKDKIYLSFDFNEQRKVKPTTVIKHFCQGIIWFPFQRYNIKQWEVTKLHNKLKCHDFDGVIAKYEEFFDDKLD